MYHQLPPIINKINDKYYMVSKDRCVLKEDYLNNRIYPRPIFDFFEEMEKEDFDALEVHFALYSLSKQFS